MSLQDLTPFGAFGVTPFGARPSIECRWTRKLLYLVFHFMLGISICSSLVMAQESEGESNAIDQFVYSGPLFIKGKSSLEEFRSLGSVLHERHENRTNPYNAKVQDEFVELIFDGLEIYGRMDKTVQNKFLPIRIKITSRKWVISEGLDIGVNANRVKSKLGLPTKRSVGSEEYCGETECVFFYIRNGKISGIEFSYYAD